MGEEIPHTTDQPWDLWAMMALPGRLDDMARELRSSIEPKAYEALCEKHEAMAHKHVPPGEQDEAIASMMHGDQEAAERFCVVDGIRLTLKSMAKKMVELDELRQKPKHRVAVKNSYAEGVIIQKIMRQHDKLVMTFMVSGNLERSQATFLVEAIEDALRKELGVKSRYSIPGNGRN